MKLVLLLQFAAVLVNGRSITPDQVSTIEPLPAAETRVHDHRYRFRYKVAEEATGDFQSRIESRNAKGVVTGSYRFLQPNGCVRVVKYTADEFGFHPVVTYEGDCQHHTTSFPPSPSSGEESLTKPVQASAAATTEGKTIDLNPLSRPVQSAITPSFTPGEMITAPVNGGQNIASFRPTLALDGQSADYSLSLSDPIENEKASERFTPALFQQFQNLTNLPFAVLGNLAQQIGQIGRPATTTTTTTSAPSTSASIVVETNNENTVKENSKFSPDGGNSVNILSTSSSNPNPRDNAAIPDSILTLLQSFPSNEQRLSGSSTTEEDPVKASASEVVPDIATDSSSANAEMISSENDKERVGAAGFFGFPTLPNLFETIIPGISSVAKPIGNSVPMASSNSAQGMENTEGPVVESSLKTTQQGPTSTNIISQVLNTLTPSTPEAFPVISLDKVQPSTAVPTTATVVSLTALPAAVPEPVQMLQNLDPTPLMNSLPNFASPSTENGSPTLSKVDTSASSTITDTDDSHDSQKSPTLSSTVAAVTSDTQNAQNTLKSDVTDLEIDNSHIVVANPTEEGQKSEPLKTVADIDTQKSQILLTPEDPTTPMITTSETEIVPHTNVAVPNFAIPQNLNSLAIEIADPNLRETSNQLPINELTNIKEGEIRPSQMTDTRSSNAEIGPSSLEETVVSRDAFTIPDGQSSINPMPGTIIISQPVESGPFIVRTPKKLPMNNQQQQKVTQQQSPNRMTAVVPARSFLSMPYGMRTMHHQAYVPAYQIGTADYGRQTNQQVPYITQRMHSVPASASVQPMSVGNGQTAGSFNSYTVQPPSQTQPTWSPYYSAYVYH